MVAHKANMVHLGTSASPFSLLDVRTSQTISLPEQKGDLATLIMFLSNHCPYVKHVRNELVRITADYTPKGVQVMAINANDAESYPVEEPEVMRSLAQECAFPFPYLYDPSQEAAKLYGASCTPDFFLFDANLQLAYHGQLDASRPDNDHPLTGGDLRDALYKTGANEPVDQNQQPSSGSPIKWRLT
ncbi:thioredoxin family protein [Bacillaceae bacterium SIJ1]|uniref:thioredoxin family protein n=1 Tax=Litoribacterium kuwaitense TaxID=1398745 RepID=UPI0013EBE652|nr:thioredoxin family protein [Litoribacterium kuwaitense]NGP46480.1 thioredoxin family protein [Litoribacterium kuwaitense]